MNERSGTGTWERYPDRAVLLVSVGNSRARLSLLRAGTLGESHAVEVSDLAGVIAAARACVGEEAGVIALLASVNNALADRISASLIEEVDEVFRVGRDAAIPLRMDLDDASTVGQDRLLACLAAFRTMQQACIVIDAGTAITVNFIDGKGVFQGGVIAPGLGLMLRAMSGGTAHLPEVVLTPAQADEDAARGPYGKDTPHAMRLGAIYAARGLVRHAVEAFAEAYEAYPTVIATGGDAALLFEGDGLVDRIVPDLVLMGMREICSRDPDRDDDGDEDESA